MIEQGNEEVKETSKKYVMFVINRDTVITHSDLYSNFEYDSTLVTDSYCTEFKMHKIEALINDIINNSEYELISVCGYQQQLVYNFIRYVK